MIKGTQYVISELWSQAKACKPEIVRAGRATLGTPDQDPHKPRKFFRDQDYNQGEAVSLRASTKFDKHYRGPQLPAVRLFLSLLL